MPDTPLTTLQYLSLRARGGLEAAGITTLEQASAMTDVELLAVKHVGWGSIERIRDWADGKPEKPPEKVIRDPVDGRVFELYKLRLAGGMEPEDALATAQQDLAVFNGEA